MIELPPKRPEDEGREVEAIVLSTRAYDSLRTVARTVIDTDNPRAALACRFNGVPILVCDKWVQGSEVCEIYDLDAFLRAHEEGRL